MGYYIRVFCTSKEKPTINDLLENLNLSGYPIESNLDLENEKAVEWTKFELNYDSERMPLLVEINEVGKSDSLAEEEIAEFLEWIGKPKFFEFKKKKVIQHLNKTKYIVCIQLPTSDIVDTGYAVNSALMTYLEKNFLGMIQADGEGFYFNTQLWLELE